MFVIKGLRWDCRGRGHSNKEVFLNKTGKTVEILSWEHVVPMLTHGSSTLVLMKTCIFSSGMEHRSGDSVQLKWTGQSKGQVQGHKKYMTWEGVNRVLLEIPLRNGKAKPRSETKMRGGLRVPHWA